MRVEKGFIHPSVIVYAGAFQSTVGKMAQHGWEFETNIDNWNYSTRILAKSSFGVFSANVPEAQLMHTNAYPFIYFPRETVLDAKHLVERIEMPVQELMPIKAAEVFSSTMPGIMDIMVYESKKDVALFTKNDILVTAEDIPELLLKIQEAQKPKAKEILAKQLSRNKLEEYKVQAKILSFN